MEPLDFSWTKIKIKAQKTPRKALVLVVGYGLLA